MKKLITFLLCSLLMIVIIIATLLSVNAYVIKKSEPSILEPAEVKKGYDCILVLGCKVNGNTPSHMLEDRLSLAVDLYKKGAAEKIIMSGDHGREEYDEVNVMKKYAIEHGVPSEDIFMDHAGFSTYESLYRAKEIFKVKKMLIVTQDYHLPRAIYNATAMGIEANGTYHKPREYAGQFYRDIREILARNKDFIFCIFKPEPTYLGESIPIWNSGDKTNDK